MDDEIAALRDRIDEARGELHAVKAVMLALLHTMRTDPQVRLEVARSLAGLEEALSPWVVTVPILEGVEAVVVAVKRTFAA